MEQGYKVIRDDGLDHGTNNSPSNDSPRQGGGKKNTGWIVALAVFLAASGLANIVQSNKAAEDNARWQSRLNDVEYNMQNQLDRANSKLDEYQEKNQKLTEYAMPIYVKSVKIGNVYNDGTIETDYGKTLYSRNTMFLKAKIDYYGLTRIGDEIEFKYKLFKNGTLSTGDSSPSGYSSSFKVTVREGDNSATGRGWGNQSKGHWQAGNYRYELWYKDVCLKAYEFRIYD